MKRKKEKIFVVRNNEIRKYGCVDAEGKVVIPFHYNWIHNNIIMDRFLIAVKDGMDGVIDVDENIIIPFEYEGIETHKSGKIPLFITEKSGQDTLVDSDGKTLLSFKDCSLEWLDNDNPPFLIIYKNGKRGIIDMNGKTILPCIYSYIELWDANNHYLIVEKKLKSGLIDLTGKIIVPLEYDRISPYPKDESKLLLEKNNKTELFDFDNNLLLPYEEEKTEDEDERKLEALRTAIYEFGIIDQNGTVLYPFEHNGIDDPWPDSIGIDDPIMIIEKDDKYGVINNERKLIFPFEYDEIDCDWIPFGFKVMNVKKKGKHGVISSSGVIIPIEYDDLHFVDFASARSTIVKKNGKLGVVTFDNEMVLPCQYDEIYWSYDESNGVYGIFYEALKDKKWGLYNWKGKLLVPHEYDTMLSEDYYSDFWIVRQNNKFGIITSTGDVVVPLEYDKITVFSRKSRSIYRNPYFFELEKKGEPPLIFNRKTISAKPYKYKKSIYFSTDDRK